jgi:ABC-type polysaccharide/polyol phosphate export permease
MNPIYNDTADLCIVLFMLQILPVCWPREFGPSQVQAVVSMSYNPCIHCLVLVDSRNGFEGVSISL